MKKTEKQQNALKGVTLPFEKFGCLRNLPVDEAGEIIQTVLAYGMDGTKPEFKDKYQQRYYESFLAPITEQIANAEKRAVQCREAAQQRADALKAAKKIIAMQEREAKAAKNNGQQIVQLLIRCLTMLIVQNVLMNHQRLLKLQPTRTRTVRSLTIRCVTQQL